LRTRGGTLLDLPAQAGVPSRDLADFHEHLWRYDHDAVHG
jgi:hypothetical protein